jgi:hypothetical protein
VGGQLLASGLSQFGQGLGGGLGDALQKYEEDKAKAAMADITMDYAKNIPGAVSPEALQRYHQANAKEKAYIALGAQANLKNMLERQQQEWQSRISAAHANYYQSQAAAENVPFEPTMSVVKDPVTGQYHTFARTSKGQVQQLTKESPYAGQIEYDEQGNPIGKYDPQGRFIRFQAPPDPLKAAIARQLEPGTAPTPTPAPAPQTRAAAPQARAAGPRAQAAPVQVKSVAEAMKLDPGTLFIDPQGTLRRR